MGGRTLRYQIRREAKPGERGAFIEKADFWAFTISQHNTHHAAIVAFKRLPAGACKTAYIYYTVDFSTLQTWCTDCGTYHPGSR